MAYDEALAERVRTIIGVRAQITERKMFGALVWMLAGNMAVGAVGDDLLVRLDPEDGERALAEPHVRPFEMGGNRASTGWVVVDAGAITEETDLAHWVDLGAEFAAALPPKT